MAKDTKRVRIAIKKIEAPKRGSGISAVTRCM